MAQESIKDKNLSSDETAKLKSLINSLVVSLTHMDDIRAQMKEDVGEVAAELELKSSEIMDAAKTLHKQNMAQKRQKLSATEEMLTELGYDISSDDEI